MPAAELARQELEPLVKARRREPSVAEVGEWQDEQSGQRRPGATSRWNRGKDLSWGAAADREGGRGRLRHLQVGNTLPARHPFQAVADGQADDGGVSRSAGRRPPYDLGR